MGCPLCRGESAGVSPPLDHGLCLECWSALPNLVAADGQRIEWTGLDWATWGADRARLALAHLVLDHVTAP